MKRWGRAEEETAYWEQWAPIVQSAAERTDQGTKTPQHSPFRRQKALPVADSDTSLPQKPEKPAPLSKWSWMSDFEPYGNFQRVGKPQAARPEPKRLDWQQRNYQQLACHRVDCDRKGELEFEPGWQREPAARSLQQPSLIRQRGSSRRYGQATCNNS